MKRNEYRDNLIRKDYYHGVGRILAKWYKVSPSRISQVVHSEAPQSKSKSFWVKLIEWIGR